MTTIIDTILIGAIKPLNNSGHGSGIDKHAISDAVWVSKNGVTGDFQGDLIRHGGPEKALHHYAFEHYDFWRHELGDKAILLKPGAFGENLSSSGLTEQNVYIGDIYELGGTIIQVTQARQPCWKLNHRFEHNDMSASVQTSMRTGWYYRILKEGWINAGCEMKLLQRENPEWPLLRLLDLLYRRTLDYEHLLEAAKIPSLTESWRVLFEKRIHTQLVEDWSSRLNG